MLEFGTYPKGEVHSHPVNICQHRENGSQAQVSVFPGGFPFLDPEGHFPSSQKLRSARVCQEAPLALGSSLGRALARTADGSLEAGGKRWRLLWDQRGKVQGGVVERG